jgi:hypothetical protein
MDGPFAMQDRQDLTNVNKHFHNFVGQNQRKVKSEIGMKNLLVFK